MEAILEQQETLMPKVEIRPLSWEQRLNAAEARGSFTEEDKELALSWTTCAIGERFHTTEDNAIFAILSDGRKLREVNWEAVRLGGLFNGYINLNNTEAARDIYNQIQSLTL